MTVDLTNPLPSERQVMAHHYYITPPVSLEQVRKEANARTTDRRKKEDSVIHFHEYDDNGDGCIDKEHEYYWKEAE